MFFRHPRSAWLVLLGLLATFPLVAWCASLTGQRFRNDLVDWVDQDSSAASQFAEFRQQFGLSEYALMTWRGCDLEDHRLDSVAAALRSPGLQQWIAQVSSGRAALRDLIQSTGLPKHVAKQRLSGLAIGTDGTSTGVFFELTTQGRENRSEAFAAITAAARQYIPPDQIQWAGLAHDLHVLDHDGFHSPFFMLPWIMLTAFALTWLFIGDLRLALFINALGTYCGCLAFTFIYFTDFELNAIVWPLPTLMTLLTISASLHFMGYYRSAVSQVTETSDLSGGRLQFAIVRRAWMDAWRPTLYCSITTAVGLLSLMLSHTQPVRQFGMFGSISIVSCSLLTLLAMPAWLALFPPVTRRTTNRPDNQHAIWSWLADRTRDYRKQIIVAGALTILVFGASISRIRTGTDLRSFFPLGHRVLSDADTVERKIGTLSSIELLLRFENPQLKNDLDRIRLIRSLGQNIIGETEIAAVLSAATITPQLGPPTRGIKRVAQNRKLERLKDELGSLQLLHVADDDEIEADAETETWRVSLRYSSLHSVDVESLADHCKEEVKRLFLPDGNCVFDEEKLQVITTGEFVLFDDLDRQFLTDLITTYSTAFVLVFVLVLLILRSFAGATLAAMPNLLPAVLVFGVAGMLSLSLDAASLLTASVALGIAVDDTLHLIIWWRNHQVDGASSHDSLKDAMQHCGMAVVQTSVICGFSIGLYAFCGFLPTVRFGILLLVMLLAALVGDLILLPALLSTSLAKRR